MNDDSRKKGARADLKCAMTSKRLPFALVFVAFAFSLAFVQVSAAFGDDGLEPLTVGVPADRCPVFYQDADTGEIVGIGVDLMRSASQAAGYDPVFEAVEEPTLKEALDNAAYDVVMPFGSAIESASGQPSIVTENLIQTPFTLVTEGKRNLPPLETLRIGMLRSLGGGAETVQQLYPGVEIVMYETMDECVNALRAGDVDALLHNSYVWSYVLQKPAYSDLNVQPSTMFSMDFRAGTLDTPSGRAIIDRLNQGIATLGDTQRESIILDYTTRRLYRYDTADYLHQYGALIGLIALLVVAFIVILIQNRRTYRLRQEEKMRQLIDHDPLTGAYSLNGFRKRVEEILRAHSDVQYVLSYNNIRNFKYINDSYGMDAGDELLRFWVDKSLATFADDEVMGRLEADHIAVLRRVGGDERMRQDGEDVLDPVRNYFIDRGKEMQVQLCSGVYVLTPEDYQKIDVDHMLDLARVAEKRVRDAQHDGFEFYNPEQWEKGKLSADIVSHLPLAIKSEELQVWYQPQVDNDRQTITGVEALCRWDHGKLGCLLPSEFIPTLEATGLIYDLDTYIWDKVCQDLRRWNERELHLSASVNLSRCDIREDGNIPEHFETLVRTYGLTPDQLRVEVTETAYADDSELLISTTEKLRELGIAVEMDDFGSGYSSLHMLKEVPVDRIKLDMDFLTGTGDQQRGRTIVSHIIQMVNSLGMELIAEGVETADQADFLRNRGCTNMQGFFFYKPMPVGDFERVLGLQD